MSYIIIPSRRTRQPQGAVRFLPEFTLANVCISFSNNLNVGVSRGVQPTFNAGATPFAATIGGIAAQVPSSGPYVNLGNTSATQLSISSGLIAYIPKQVGSVVTLLTTSFSAGNNGLNVEQKTTGTIALNKQNTAGIVETTSKAKANQVNFVAWSYNNSTGQAVVGINGSTVTATSAQTLTHDQTVLGRFRSADTALSNALDILLFAFFPFTQSQAWVQKFSENGFLAFQSDPRRIYFDVPAAPVSGTYIQAPSRRTRQPQGIPRFNPALPAPAFCYVPSFGLIDIAGYRNGAKASGDSLRGTTQGISYKVARAANGGLDFGSVRPLTGNVWTLVAFANPASGDGISTLISQRYGTPSYPSMNLIANADQSYASSAGRVSVYVRTTSGGVFGTQTTSTAAADGNWHVFTTTRDGIDSLPVIYIDGVAVATTNTGSGGAVTSYSASQKFRVGNMGDYTADNAYCSACDIALVLAFNSALPAAQIAAFNPLDVWAAVFASDPRRLYFGAGATGGGNITFEALPSSLSLAGSLANLWANRLLTANPASFTFAGATASTLASRKVLANPSTLTMTGATGTLKWNRVFVASPGTLGFTGSVANFLLGKILTANPGSLNLTGATATVKKNSFIIADPGALSFVGQSAGLFRGRIMTADPGSLTLSGAVASLFHFRVLPADPGTLVLTGATATLAAPGTVQRARPSSDISSNGWLPSSGSDLYAMLDETSYNDSDYIYSPDNPTTQAAEVKFSAITDPGVNTGHVLRFRLAAVGQDTVFDVYLMCGATQIATWQKTVIAGVTTTYSETLTVGEAGNITDYSDLRIKVVAHA